MKKLVLALSFVKEHLLWFIPITMLLGVFFGSYFDATPLKMAIFPLTLGMIYPMMVTLNYRAIFTECNFKVQGTIQVINFLIIPLIGYGIGQYFFTDRPMYAFGILLLALLPTSGMTISWTGFAHGNINIAIKASVIGLLSGALLTPFYGNILMGQTIEIPLLKTFQKIGLIIFIPLIVGWLTQYVLIKKAGIEKFNRVIKPKFPLLATISVLGIIFVALALKAKTISTQPELLLKLLFPVFVFYSINFLFTTIIGRLFFVYEDAIALVYGTTVRTLSVALAISMTLFADQGSDIVLIISAAYIVQLQAAAWYVKFADFLLKPSKNRGKTP